MAAQVIGIEDLIVDRLAACKRWGDQDSCDWAETILAGGHDVDLPYLRRRASDEDVADKLEPMLSEGAEQVRTLELSGEASGSVRLLARFASGPRRVRRRPRTSDDRALIRRMALAQVARRCDEGRLIRLGEREYELRIPKR